MHQLFNSGADVGAKPIYVWLGSVEASIVRGLVTKILKLIQAALRVPPDVKPRALFLQSA